MGSNVTFEKIVITQQQQAYQRISHLQMSQKKILRKCHIWFINWEVILN
jgi:hypothetical protein